MGRLSLCRDIQPDRFVHLGTHFCELRGDKFAPGRLCHLPAVRVHVSRYDEVLRGVDGHLLAPYLKDGLADPLNVFL